MSHEVMVICLPVDAHREGMTIAEARAAAGAVTQMITVDLDRPTLPEAVIVVGDTVTPHVFNEVRKALEQQLPRRTYTGRTFPAIPVTEPAFYKIRKDPPPKLTREQIRGANHRRKR